MKNGPFLFLLLAVVACATVCFRSGEACAQPSDDVQEPQIEFGDTEIEFGDADQFDFAPGQGPEAVPKAFLAAVGVFALIGLLVGLAIAIVIIVLISGALKTVPQEYREMEPALVWLLLIPLFNLIWNFFVFPKVAKSFQNYFEAQERTEFGDCGQNIGLWYAICAVCSVVPYIGCVASVAALVLLIMYLVKVVGLKKFVTA